VLWLTARPVHPRVATGVTIKGAWLRAEW
jgi:hypothetical protein